MSEEIKGLIEAHSHAFEQFKAANDERIKAEAKGAVDTLIETKLSKVNDALDAVGAQIKALELKAARPGAGISGMTDAQAEYKSKWNDWARTGEGEREVKALATTVGQDGGFAVPELIDTAIRDRLVDISPVRSVATIVTVGTTDYKRLVNRRGTASGWVGETAVRPETGTSVLQEIAPPMGTLYANPAATQISLEDVFFNVESWLASEVATEFARAEGAAFINGTGTNQPRGFLNGTPVVTADAARAAGVLQYVPSGVAAALPTSVDVYMDIVASLKAGLRAGSVWMMPKSVVFAIRKLKDTTGQYLWQPGVADGNPDRFLGYSVVEAEDMPAVAANTFSVAFGNFGAGYLVVDRMGTTTLRDPFTNKPYVMFYTTKRVGGSVLDSEAIKLLRCSLT